MQKLHTAYNLVAALREIYASVSLEVISQKLDLATREEQELLNITENNSWIREVNLLGDGKIVVNARVVAPFSTYQHFTTQLDNLGNKFLGESFLYITPHARSDFEYVLMNIDQLLRRSIFTINQHRLLVSELFL